MSDDYTPSIDDLRDAYVQSQLGADGYSAEAREAEFDRALAAHDQEQRAGALELAADECEDVLTELVLAQTYAEARDVLKDFLHGMAARARGDQP